MTGKYNPLADFIGRLMDKFIADYIQACQESHQAASLEGFKDLLNEQYKQGMSANTCLSLAKRFESKINQ